VGVAGPKNLWSNDRKKERKKMEKVMVFYVSDCCGVESDVDHEICFRCGEHCEIVECENAAEY
jgi:hypothetical protein